MTRNRIIVGLATLAIVLVVAGALLYTQLGRIIRGGVESHGPQITGTPVRLAGAKVSPFSGQGGLQGLEIANPEGFTAPYAFLMDDIEIDIQTDSVTQEVILIRSIVVTGPKLIAEFTEDGESNLKTIMRHVRKLSSDQRGQAGARDSSRPARKLIIDRFVLSNAQVRVLAPTLGLDEQLEIADFELRDIGKAQGGAAVEDVAQQLLRPVIDSAVDAARSKYIGTRRAEIRQLIKDEAKELMDKLFKKD